MSYYILCDKTLKTVLRPQVVGLAICLLARLASAQTLQIWDDGRGLWGMSRNGEWLVGYQLADPANAEPERYGFRWSSETGQERLVLDRAADPSFELPAFPRAVSDQGNRFVGHGESPFSGDSDTEVFRWRDTDGWNTLTASDSWLARASGDARAIAGTMVRNEGDDDVRRAFRWSESEGLISIPFLEHAGYSATGFAEDMSADGKVVVGTHRFYLSTPLGAGQTFTEAFRWTEAAGTERLLQPAAVGRDSAATAVSPDGGWVAGTISIEQILYPYLWSEASGMSLLPDDSLSHQGFLGIAAVSEDARWIVGDTDAGSIVWTPSRELLSAHDFLVAESGLAIDDWREVSIGWLSDDGLTMAGHALRENSRIAWHFRMVPEPMGQTMVGGLLILFLACHPRRWAGR